MRASATGIPSIISWLCKVESWTWTKLESCSARSRLCSCSRLVHKPSEFSWKCGQYTLPHTLVIWVMGNQTLGRSSCLCFFIALRRKACGQECSTEGTKHMQQKLLWKLSWVTCCYAVNADVSSRLVSPHAWAESGVLAEAKTRRQNPQNAGDKISLNGRK